MASLSRLAVEFLCMTQSYLAVANYPPVQLSLSCPGRCWGLSQPWYHADPLSRTKAACISLCLCRPPLPHTMMGRLLPHCSHSPAEENDSLVHRGRNGAEGKGTGVAAFLYQGQDGALSRALGHPGNREGGLSPHHRGDVMEKLVQSFMGTV